jgi:hypothetical protein
MTIVAVQKGNIHVIREADFSSYGKTCIGDFPDNQYRKIEESLIPNCAESDMKWENDNADTGNLVQKTEQEKQEDTRRNLDIALRNSQATIVAKCKGAVWSILNGTLVDDSVLIAELLMRTSLRQEIRDTPTFLQQYRNTLEDRIVAVQLMQQARYNELAQCTMIEQIDTLMEGYTW